MPNKPFSYDPDTDTPDALAPQVVASQQRIKEHRKSRLIDDNAVTVRLRIHKAEMRPSLFYAIERGDRALTVERAQVVAKVLNLSLGELEAVLRGQAERMFTPESLESPELFSKRERFGAALRDVRKRFNMSQAGLAEKSGITQNYISLLENRDDVPRPETVVRLAQALGVKWQVLVPIHKSAKVSARIEELLQPVSDAALLEDLKDVL